jgi:myo-inositol-hexaphosphate 3-phosphohydrolase
MQIEIDKLNVNISVCYDRISRKDQEIRKLIIQIEELQIWKVKYEQLKIEHKKEIDRIKHEYE